MKNSDVGETTAQQPGRPPIRGSLRADEEIAKRIANVGYNPDHPTAVELMSELAPYAVGTLIAMFTKGTLFAKCKRLGMRSLPDPPPTWSSEAAQILALATLEARCGFIQHSLPEWKPDGGASLGTWFVNYVLLAKFRRYYEAHCREWGARLREVVLDDVSIAHVTNLRNDAEELAIIRIALQRATADADSRLTEILQMRIDGLSQGEIAARLGISDRTVRRYLAGLGKKLRVELHGR